MSLLQNEEYTIYRLRTSYLSTIKDGVGERLITVNPAIVNTPAFRSAGWQPNISEIKRTYSPPIPTAITSEYFQVPPLSTGADGQKVGNEEEGGIISGIGGTGETIGPNLHSKRRRIRHQLEEEDSSDLSDESDEEADLTTRAQQIRFAKMPVRTRSGSSPIRSSAAREGPSVFVTSPSRPPGSHRLRRGSLGAVEAVKERARRDTATSSEISSENELDPSYFKKRSTPASSGRASGIPEEGATSIQRRQTKDSTDLEDEGEDSGDDSEGSVISSDFDEAAGSESLLDSVPNPLTSSIPSIPAQLAGLATSGRATPSPGRSVARPRAPMTVMKELPPPRPISMVLPVSALTQAIKAKRSKAASPFESFATLSGKGDPNPLQLRIFAAQSLSNPFTVTICRTTQSEDANGNRIQRQVTVADAIGLSLWRYSEEKISPPVEADKMNVNWWTLRMVEDGEVEYDFPALERNKPMVSFASNNNRGGRSRSNSRPFDEFALVAATPAQFQENSRITPNFTHEAASTSSNTDDPLTPVEEDAPSAASIPAPAPPPRARNPLLSQFPAAATTLGRDYTIPTSSSAGPAPRTGISKILQIHLEGSDPWSSQLIAMDVTTDTYIADILTSVCQKRNLEKAHHIFRLSGTNILVPTDRTVESLGDRIDLDLIRRRFAHDGPLALSGSPTGANTSPNAPLLVEDDNSPSGSGSGKANDGGRPRGGSGGKLSGKQQRLLGGISTHPLADSFLPSHHLAASKRYTVWRKQPMSFLPTHERTLAIEGEYLVIMPGHAADANNPAHPKSGGVGLLSGGITHRGGETGKTTTIHFANVVGAKCKERGAGFKIVVFRDGAGDNKRYEFEAINSEEAAEIVAEVNRGLERFKGGEI